MSPTLIATLAGLTTALCWGTSDWLAAKSSKKLSELEINFAVSVAGIAMMAGLLLFYSYHVPTLSQLLTLMAGSTLITIAYLLFVKALSSGVVGIIVPIGNSYALVTVGLSVLLLSETFSGRQIGAMLGIIFGAALLAYEKNHKKIPLRELHKETMLAVGAAITWGLAFFVINSVVDQLSWQTITITGEIYGITLASLLLFMANGIKTILSVKRVFAYKTAILTGILGTTGAVALYFGSDHAGSIIIPTVLSAGGPLVASLWGALFDHERIGALKRVGAVVVVAGIIVLNIG